MGAVCGTPEVREMKKVNAEIEKDIRKAEREVKIKLLLLGAAECGKSTILKQMKLLHSDGFTDKELANQISIFYSNMLYGMETMLTACRTLQIGVYKNLEENARIISDWLAADRAHERFSADVQRALTELWASADIQQAYSRRSEYQLSDSIAHFFNDIDRISKPDYKPSTLDMLYVRVPTTGVVEITFPVSGVPFSVFDVGGQRAERRKWIHVFDDVNAIIFLVALSEYDQVLMEDSMTNRMLEALNLFGQMLNHRLFTKCCMILFLNKNDLFQEKIKHKPITLAFPEYQGPHEEEASREFIKLRFEGAKVDPDKSVFTHITCATDTNQVELIISGVLTVIMEENMKGMGLA